MEQEYQRIKETYDRFYEYLLKNGRLPVKDTGIGYWGISVADELIKLFQEINLAKNKKFLDLGSGDGKAVLIASLFTNATGIEYDPWLHENAVNIKRELQQIPHTKRATLINADFLTHDLSRYDIIFIHPDKHFMQLETKLKRELNGTLLVLGAHYLPQELTLKETINVGTPVNIYINEQ